MPGVPHLKTPTPNEKSAPELGGEGCPYPDRTFSSNHTHRTDQR
jgi:hypothetical protein